MLPLKRLLLALFLSANLVAVAPRGVKKRSKEDCVKAVITFLHISPIGVNEKDSEKSCQALQGIAKSNKRMFESAEAAPDTWKHNCTATNDNKKITTCYCDLTSWRFNPMWTLQADDEYSDYVEPLAGVDYQHYFFSYPHMWSYMEWNWRPDAKKHGVHCFDKGH